MKPNFTLPKTKFSNVVWYRNGNRNEVLLDTPRSNADLFYTMLVKHRVGFSEIRAVVPVEPATLETIIGRNSVGHRR